MLKRTATPFITVHYVFLHLVKWSLPSESPHFAPTKALLGMVSQRVMERICLHLCQLPENPLSCLWDSLGN